MSKSDFPDFSDDARATGEAMAHVCNVTKLARRVSALERNAASHASRLDDLAQRRWRGKILELSDFPAVAERHELRVVAGEWDGVGPVVVYCEEGV